jgi:DNA-binding CsgD family transcriptional regulator
MKLYLLESVPVIANYLKLELCEKDALFSECIRLTDMKELEQCLNRKIGTEKNETSYLIISNLHANGIYLFSLKPIQHCANHLMVLDNRLSFSVSVCDALLSVKPKYQVSKESLDEEAITRLKKAIVSQNGLVSDDVSEAKHRFQERLLDYKNNKVLTKREEDVLKMWINYESNDYIADKLSISASTVRGIKSNLLQKLQLNNILELLAYCKSHPYLFSIADYNRTD